MCDIHSSPISVDSAIESLYDTSLMKSLFIDKAEKIYPSECHILQKITNKPINLNTIRNYPDYKNKIHELCKNETLSYYLKYSGFENAYYFQTITKYIIYENVIIQILKIILTYNGFRLLQCKFKQWTYTPGNPGFLRINKGFTKKLAKQENKKLKEQLLAASYGFTKQYKKRFCCYTNQINYSDLDTDSNSDSENEWSD